MMAKKPNLELHNWIEEGDETTIVLKGKDLKVQWLDSYLLVWSKEEHDE